MNIVLIPQGSTVNMVLSPHRDFVEIVVFAHRLDDQVLRFATEHLKLALLLNPCRAAVLEMIASEHELDGSEDRAQWCKALDGVPPSMKLAYVIRGAAVEPSRIAHDRGALVKIFATRRAALQWLEQTDLPPVSRPSASGRIKKVVHWLFGARKDDWSAAGGLE